MGKEPWAGGFILSSLQVQSVSSTSPCSSPGIKQKITNSNWEEVSGARSDPNIHQCIHPSNAYSGFSRHVLPQLNSILHVHVSHIHQPAIPLFVLSQCKKQDWNPVITAISVYILAWIPYSNPFVYFASSVSSHITVLTPTIIESQIYNQPRFSLKMQP